MVRELRRRGINIPSDLAVVGFDNIDLTRYSSPPLTTVAQPIYGLGKTAGLLLFGLLHGENVPLRTTIDTELIIRESCGCRPYEKQPASIPNLHEKKGSLEERFASARDTIVGEILEIIKRIHGKERDDQLTELVMKFVSSFFESLVAGEPAIFLNVWDELLYSLMFSEMDVLLSDEILSVYRRYIIPFIEDKKLMLNAIDLYHNALAVVGRKAVQSEKYDHLKKEAENFRLNMLRDDLLVISDVKRLTDVLEIGLKPIEIENVFIALYSGAKPEKKELAKLIFAYSHGARMRIPTGRKYYEPVKIIPDEFHENDRRNVRVIEPLIHSSEFLGFMVLDFYLDKYFIYEELRRTISRALHGALLFGQVQSRTRALKENEKSLRAITGAIPLPFVIMRMSDGGILYANIPFCKVFGADPERYTEEYIYQYSGNRSSFDVLMKRLENDKQVANIELPMRRSDGTQFWVIASFRTLVFGGKKCFIGGFYDITERRRLEKEVLDISGREQRRIGQELHDDICQDLVGISTLIQAVGNRAKEFDTTIADRADYIAELVNKTNEKTQWLAHGLFPQDIDEKGFAVMLKELALRIKMQFNIACSCSFAIRDKITDNVTIFHLYRIAQEAMNNAVKHGKPREIKIVLVSDEHRIELEITDDGSGIPEKIKNSKGMGLRSMRYRATMIGGRLDVRRREGRGTSVSCVIEKISISP
jgi:PAS domain S-box-containing protein